ncbi:MAG: hypothetical protein AB9883_02175 [Acidaminococcaceae bacterium]
MTGLLHISDRMLAGELSRVEAARGNLYPLTIYNIYIYSKHLHLYVPVAK